MAQFSRITRGFAHSWRGAAGSVRDRLDHDPPPPTGVDLSAERIHFFTVVGPDLNEEGVRMASPELEDDLGDRICWARTGQLASRSTQDGSQPWAWLDERPRGTSDAVYGDRKPVDESHVRNGTHSLASVRLCSIEPGSTSEHPPCPS